MGVTVRDAWRLSPQGKRICGGGGRSRRGIPGRRWPAVPSVARWHLPAVAGVGVAPSGWSWHLRYGAGVLYAVPGPGGLPDAGRDDGGAGVDGFDLGRVDA